MYKKLYTEGKRKKLGKASFRLFLSLKDCKVITHLKKMFTGSNIRHDVVQNLCIALFSYMPQSSY